MTTNSYKEIGGYFGLEISKIWNSNINATIALNTGKNALRYIIKAFSIEEIWMPYYTCPIVWNAAKNENCKINFYHIDRNFLPTTIFNDNSYVLYTNYFGICAKNIKELAKKYKNLIVDNAQAFYMPKYGIASFNSLRKFFGVPDGSFLICDKTMNENFKEDESYKRCSHLLKRIDINAEFGYQDFKNNDIALAQEDIKTMSKLTCTLINSIDTIKAKETRLSNFNILSSRLKTTNNLNIALDIDDVPMCYPYMTDNINLRQKLIQNKVYIPTYWDEQPKEFYEYKLRNNILPLPIDQRYDKKAMNRILEIINV